jgi:beta-galactosidase
MKNLTALIIATVLCTSIAAQKSQRFFPDSELITTGVYYYPEHWPSNEWERDIKNISGMGFEFVHMAELAWQEIQKDENTYNFTWLDKAIDLCAKYKLKVILGTPTAAPPAWLGIKYPEIYLYDDYYVHHEHGGRAQYSTSSDIYWQYTEKFVTEIAKRYGQNKTVWGWQIDNEPWAQYDFGPLATAKFRLWLKKRYTTIENLNKAWGTAFWSVGYNNFDEIKIPNPRITPGISQHHVLDFKRFNAEQQALYLDFQADILHKYTKNQFVTTNYMGMVIQMDPKYTKNLDFPSFTGYPLGGGASLGDNGFRLGWDLDLSYALPFYHNINGLTGIMELQPGQVNWGDPNPQPLPGAVRMWLWHVYAGGCKFACTYRFRQILYGTEQYHAGMMKIDGVTLSQGGKDYQEFMSEINSLRKLYKPAPVMPEKYRKRNTAILFSHENWWDLEYQRQTSQWSTMSHVYDYIDMPKRFGAPVDVIGEKDDFSKYNVLIAPAYQLIDSALVLKWTKYVENGGNLVLTCRTGEKDKMGHLWEGGLAAPIEKLIGGKIEFIDMLRPETKGIVNMDAKDYEWNNWGEILEAFSNTEVLATYGNQYYSGKATALYHKIGKGSVAYVGVDTDDKQFELDVLRKVYQRADIAIDNHPKGLLTFWRDGFWIAVNYSSDTYNFPLPTSASIILGEKNIKPAGVLVWKE